MANEIVDYFVSQSETWRVAFVITQGCVDIKDKTCLTVCPVDCIYEGERVDIGHPLALVDAVHRADREAGLVLDVDAPLRDHESHAPSLALANEIVNNLVRHFSIERNFVDDALGTALQ